MVVAVSGWVWALPFAAMALICPLMMLSMVAMAVPWVRRLFGGASDSGSGHGLMMCHGMSHSGEGHTEQPTPAASGGQGDLLAELRAQREALDALIARAASQTAPGVEAAPVDGRR